VILADMKIGAQRRRARDGDASGMQRRCSWVPYIVPGTASRGAGRRNGGVWWWCSLTSSVTGEMAMRRKSVQGRRGEDDTAVPVYLLGGSWRCRMAQQRDLWPAVVFLTEEEDKASLSQKEQTGQK
jgi:hypothetical protein